MQSNEYFDSVQKAIVGAGFTLISRISITGPFYDETVVEARSTNFLFHLNGQGLLFNLECIEWDDNFSWNIQTAVRFPDNREPNRFDVPYFGTALQDHRLDQDGKRMAYYMSSLVLGRKPKVADLALAIKGIPGQLQLNQGSFRELFLPPFIPVGYFPDCMDAYMEQLDKTYLRHYVFFIAGIDYQRYFVKRKESISSEAVSAAAVMIP